MGKTILIGFLIKLILLTSGGIKMYHVVESKQSKWLIKSTIIKNKKITEGSSFLGVLDIWYIYIYIYIQGVPYQKIFFFSKETSTKCCTIMKS